METLNQQMHRFKFKNTNNQIKKINHYFFSRELTMHFYDKLHRADDIVQKNFQKLMNDFSQMNQQDQANIFFITQLNRKMEDGNDQKESFEGTFFTFSELISLWIEMIKAGLNPFRPYIHMTKNKRNYYYPIQNMLSFDTIADDIPYYDINYNDLFNAINDHVSKNELYYTDNNNSLLLTLCKNDVKNNSLNAFVSLMKKVPNKKLLEKYINYQDEFGKNCLHVLLTSSINEKYWFDAFVSLIDLGADVNSEIEGWNVVSRCFLCVGTLEYLLSKGYRPTMNYKPNNKFVEYLTKSKSKSWVLDKLTPQMYTIHHYVLSVQSVQSDKNINKVSENVINRIIIMLELYDKYNMTNYDYKDKNNKTLLDFAEQTHNSKLYEYLKSKY